MGGFIVFLSSSLVAPIGAYKEKFKKFEKPFENVDKWCYIMFPVAHTGVATRGQPLLSPEVATILYLERM